MFALFTQLLPWNGEGRDVSSFEAMYITPHPKVESVKLVKKVHKEPVEGACEMSEEGADLRICFQKTLFTTLESSKYTR